MKGIVTTGLILAALPLATQAANCSGGTATRVTGAAITTALQGKTACATAPNGDSWQELHQAGGTLTEYARGPGHPRDPSHDVGTWRRAGSLVEYNYTGGSSYSFELWRAGSTYYFCTAAGGLAAQGTISTIAPPADPCP